MESMGNDDSCDNDTNVLKLDAIGPGIMAAKAGPLNSNRRRQIGT